jgi:hypothetical protein
MRSEMDLYARLEELEGAKTPAETLDLAIVHTELACLPLTPKVGGEPAFFFPLFLCLTRVSRTT